MSEPLRSVSDVTVAPLTYRPAPGWAAAHPAEVAANEEAGIAAGEPRAAPAAAPEPTADEQRKASDKLFWDEGLKEGLVRREADYAAADLQLREGISGA